MYQPKNGGAMQDKDKENVVPTAADSESSSVHDRAPPVTTGKQTHTVNHS
jgi:hypothetical protein